MTTRDIINTTTSSAVYKKALKSYRASNRLIGCAYCRYNHGENSDHYVDRSWKKFRRSQFRGSPRV